MEKVEEKIECSVVMPIYNAEKFLKDAIESVLAQTYKNFELILVDDCSTDKSAEIAKSYLSDKRVKYYKNPENLKVSKTRNFGVSVAKGKYVTFLDSDDVYLPTKLEKQIEFMEKTGAKICFTAYGYLSNDGVVQNKIFKVPEKVSFKKLLKQNVISCSIVMFERWLVEKHPFFADNVHEDFVTYLTIMKEEKLDAFGINEPLGLYRLTVGSKSRNKFKALKMTYNSYKVVGLNFFQRIFYLPFYMLNGIKKYKGMKDATDKDFIEKLSYKREK